MSSLLIAAVPSYVMWIIIAVVLVLMIVLTIVPQKKRQKEQENMMNSLTAGTKLMTVGGMVGKVSQVNSDNTLVINVGTENYPTYIVVDRKAVAYVLEAAKQATVAAPVEEAKVEVKEDVKEEVKAEEAPAEEDPFAKYDEQAKDKE